MAAEEDATKGKMGASCEDEAGMKKKAEDGESQESEELLEAVEEGPTRKSLASIMKKARKVSATELAKTESYLASLSAWRRQEMEQNMTNPDPEDEAFVDGDGGGLAMADFLAKHDRRASRVDATGMLQRMAQSRTIRLEKPVPEETAPEPEEKAPPPKTVAEETCDLCAQIAQIAQQVPMKAPQKKAPAKHVCKKKSSGRKLVNDAAAKASNKKKKDPAATNAARQDVVVVQGGQGAQEYHTPEVFACQQQGSVVSQQQQQQGVPRTGSVALSFATSTHRESPSIQEVALAHEWRYTATKSRQPKPKPVPWQTVYLKDSPRPTVSVSSPDARPPPKSVAKLLVEHPDFDEATASDGFSYLSGLAQAKGLRVRGAGKGGVSSYCSNVSHGDDEDFTRVGKRYRRKRYTTPIDDHVLYPAFWAATPNNVRDASLDGYMMMVRLGTPRAAFVGDWRYAADGRSIDLYGTSPHGGISILDGGAPETDTQPTWNYVTQPGDALEQPSVSTRVSHRTSGAPSTRRETVVSEEDLTPFQKKFAPHCAKERPSNQQRGWTRERGTRADGPPGGGEDVGSDATSLQTEKNDDPPTRQPSYCAVWRYKTKKTGPENRAQPVVAQPETTPSVEALEARIETAAKMTATDGRPGACERRALERKLHAIRGISSPPRRRHREKTQPSKEERLEAAKRRLTGTHVPPEHSLADERTRSGKNAIAAAATRLALEEIRADQASVRIVEAMARLGLVVGRSEDVGPEMVEVAETRLRLSRHFEWRLWRAKERTERHTMCYEDFDMTTKRRGVSVEHKVLELEPKPLTVPAPFNLSRSNAPFVLDVFRAALEDNKKNSRGVALRWDDPSSLERQPSLELCLDTATLLVRPTRKNGAEKPVAVPLSDVAQEPSQDQAGAVVLRSKKTHQYLATVVAPTWTDLAAAQLLVRHSADDRRRVERRRFFPRDVETSRRRRQPRLAESQWEHDYEDEFDDDTATRQTYVHTHVVDGPMPPKTPRPCRAPFVAASRAVSPRRLLPDDDENNGYCDHRPPNERAEDETLSVARRRDWRVLLETEKKKKQSESELRTSGATNESGPESPTPRSRHRPTPKSRPPPVCLTFEYEAQRVEALLKSRQGRAIITRMPKLGGPAPDEMSSVLDSTLSPPKSPRPERRTPCLPGAVSVAIVGARDDWRTRVTKEVHRLGARAVFSVSSGAEGVGEFARLCVADARPLELMFLGDVEDMASDEVIAGIERVWLKVFARVRRVAAVKIPAVVFYSGDEISDARLVQLETAGIADVVAVGSDLGPILDRYAPKHHGADHDSLVDSVADTDCHSEVRDLPSMRRRSAVSLVRPKDLAAYLTTRADPAKLAGGDPRGPRGDDDRDEDLDRALRRASVATAKRRSSVAVAAKKRRQSSLNESPRADLDRSDGGGAPPLGGCDDSPLAAAANSIHATTQQ